MKTDDKKVIDGMQLLFIAPLVSIVLMVMAVLLTPWLMLVSTVMSVVGVWMLYSGVRNNKLLVAGMMSLIALVMDVVPKLLNVPTGAEGLQVAVKLAAGLASGVHLYCLFRGTADYMVEQGYPETAQEGKTAANLSIAVTVASVVISALNLETLMDSGGYLVLLLAAVAGVLALATVAMSLILAIIRLTFFYKCRKRLMSGLPERPGRI